MKPHEVPAEIERINQGIAPVVPETHEPSISEASDHFRIMSENLARAMSTGVRRNAFAASNDLLNECLPPDESYGNIVVYHSPWIAVHEAEIAGFGLRKIAAELTATIPKGDAPKDRKLPGLGAQSSIKKADYRIWGGIQYLGEGDPLKGYLEGFRREWGRPENCIDIQHLAVNERDSGPDNPSTTVDYSPWLQWMLAKAADPANAQELHDNYVTMDDAFFNAMDAAQG